MGSPVCSSRASPASSRAPRGSSSACAAKSSAKPKVPSPENILHGSKALFYLALPLLLFEKELLALVWAPVLHLLLLHALLAAALRLQLFVSFDLVSLRAFYYNYGYWVQASPRAPASSRPPKEWAHQRARLVLHAGPRAAQGQRARLLFGPGVPPRLGRQPWPLFAAGPPFPGGLTRLSSSARAPGRSRCASSRTRCCSSPAPASSARPTPSSTPWSWPPPSPSSDSNCLSYARTCFGRSAASLGSPRRKRA